MLVIPAIDIFDGKCVRLTQGDYSRKTVYSDSPYDRAIQFKLSGFSFLHVVDLQGAKEKKIINWDSIKNLLSIPDLKIEVGGGIRTTEDIQRLLELGVTRVVIGSVAAKSPDLVEYWINQFGTDKIIIGMDIKNESVAISGWLEDSERTPADFIFDLKKRRANTFICTDISRDGMLTGANIELYSNLIKAFPDLTFIASGGISSTKDLMDLKNCNVPAVIVGKAIYEGKIPLEELSKFNGALC